MKHRQRNPFTQPLIMLGGGFNRATYQKALEFANHRSSCSWFYFAMLNVELVHRDARF